jgi:nucleotide-binding universal stress UspA family protein
MENVQKIIVSVDFHQHTQKVVDFATSVANHLGAKLTFVHVLDNVLPYYDYSPESFKLFDDKLLAHVENKMEVLVEKNRITIPECEGVVLRGDVTDSIVAYAKEAEVDLIIMGTHGARGIEKVLLGSVAERVLKSASCPVLMFNPYKGKVQ